VYDKFYGLSNGAKHSFHFFTGDYRLCENGIFLAPWLQPGLSKAYKQVAALGVKMLDINGRI
jgi:hypothetical protein